jgi:hypothetical protein
MTGNEEIKALGKESMRLLSGSDFEYSTVLEKLLQDTTFAKRGFERTPWDQLKLVGYVRS